MNTINASAWRPPLELAVFAQPTSAEAASAPAPASASGRAAEDDGFKLFGDDGFTFLDFLDIINPLHHIPVVGTLYRHFTGDEIDPGARVFGGTLFFGPLGTVASIGDVLIRDATGKDLGQHVMAMFDQSAPRRSEVAQAGGLVVADANSNAGRAAVANAQESEALDPVTHWALEEVAFRQAMAVKVQSSKESRPDIRERASVSIPAVAAAYENSRQALVASGLAQAAPAPQSAGRAIADSTGTAKAQSIIRHTKRSAAMLAAAGYGRTDQASERRKSEQPGEANSGAPLGTSPGTSLGTPPGTPTGTTMGAPTGTPPGTPFGAVAPLGGWFAGAMLMAHEKYQAGAVRPQDRLPTVLDVRH